MQPFNVQVPGQAKSPPQSLFFVFCCSHASFFFFFVPPHHRTKNMSALATQTKAPTDVESQAVTQVVPSSSLSSSSPGETKTEASSEASSPPTMVSVMTKDETYKLYALAGDTADEDGLKYCFYLKQNEEGAEVQQTFEGHSDVITFLAISDDMRHFFSASKDGKVKTWNTLGVLKGEKEGSPTSKEELLAAFDNQAKDVSFLVFGFSVLLVWISFFLVCFLCVSFIFLYFAALGLSA